MQTTNRPGQSFKGGLLITLFAALAVLGAAPASADPEPLPSYCEQVPVFGLNPYIRTICDQPIEADGSWMRARLSHYLQSTRSSCNGIYYQGGCPYWMQHDVVPERVVEDRYRVTPDTIPPGEPGHLD